MQLTDFYKNSGFVAGLCAGLAADQARIHINGLTGSLPAVVGATLSQCLPQSNLLFVAASKEDAYYLQNDLETLLCPQHENENEDKNENKDETAAAIPSRRGVPEGRGVSHYTECICGNF